MLVAILIGITSLTFFFYFVGVNGGKVVPSAPNWFVLVNGLLLVGTLQVADVTEPVALRFTLVQIAGLVAFTIGAGLVTAGVRTTPAQQIDRFVRQPLVFDLEGVPWRAVAVPLLVLSLLICVSFSVALGYHVGLSQIALAANASSSEEARQAYSSLRTEVHYGGRYLYIGYVTQFKDFILPTITALLFVKAQRLGGGLRWILLLNLVLANLYFLTTTGQRKPVLVFSIVLLLVISSPWSVIAARFRRPGLNRLIVGSVSVVALAVFIGVSAIRSRDNPASFGEVVLQGVGSFWGRLGPDLAAAKLRLAELLEGRPPSWGGDWIATLGTMLPGKSGSGLANEFHGLLYGSRRGAAGLLVWESLWLNFNWPGIIFGGLLLGAVLQWVTLRIWQGPRYASKHTILLFLSLQLGLVTEPFALFNGGVVTLTIIAMLYSITRKRAFEHKLASRTLIRNDIGQPLFRA